MGKRRRRLVVLSSLLLGSLTAVAAPTGVAAAVADPAALINPFLGTSHEANTFPGADAPFGMVQWSPDTPSPGGRRPSPSPAARRGGSRCGRERLCRW
ncbi:hypothetical protein [Amycolatopsis sp. CA-126428]|uniref:hypothetical protein n=1 Tax=Amycolatopsis sp. CA-126428 TaxID=2073158 RepID=UPI000CD01AD7|nr:hypothetical protein [Amycolatopsis sp. CA-126428]